MKQVFTFLLISISFSVAQAERNSFQMDRVGLYVGQLKSGQECSVEVLDLEKALLTRRLKAVQAIVNTPNFTIKLMENLTSVAA